MPLFESPNLVLNVESNPTIVVATWRGFMSGKSYRSNMQQVVDAMHREKASLYLANLREFLVSGPEDQQWTVDTWFPLMAQAGMRRIAVVMAESAIASMVARHVVSQFHGVDIATQYVDTDAEARAWLQLPMMDGAAAAARR